MNGLEATRAIRALARPDAATVPIVAMTANVFKEDVDAAMAAGMNGFAGKPLDVAHLYRLLYDLLNKGAENWRAAASKKSKNLLSMRKKKVLEYDMGTYPDDYPPEAILLSYSGQHTDSWDKLSEEQYHGKYSSYKWDALPRGRMRYDLEKINVKWFFIALAKIL